MAKLPSQLMHTAKNITSENHSDSGTAEEGNCSYLLPLSHREDDKLKDIVPPLTTLIENITALYIYITSFNFIPHVRKPIAICFRIKNK